MWMVGLSMSLIAVSYPVAVVAPQQVGTFLNVSLLHRHGDMPSSATERAMWAKTQFTQ